MSRPIQVDSPVVQLGGRSSLHAGTNACRELQLRGVSRSSGVVALVQRKDDGDAMMMKLAMVASALTLVACGEGKPWDGVGGEPPLPDPGGTAGSPVGGSSSYAGTGTGGYEPVGGQQWGTAGSTSWPEGGYGGAAGTAGTSWGGAYPVGGQGGYAGTATGGTGTAGSGGAAQGGEPTGGYGGTGTAGGGPSLSCLANVAHCFEAAANCFEFSPGSDCDQIVDVCAAMRADCEN